MKLSYQMTEGNFSRIFSLFLIKNLIENFFRSKMNRTETSKLMTRLAAEKKIEIIEKNEEFKLNLDTLFFEN
jgi:hypothetical protein